MEEVETFGKRMLEKRKEGRKKYRNPHRDIGGLPSGNYDWTEVIRKRLLEIDHDESCCTRGESPCGTYGDICCDCSQRDYVLAEFFLLGISPEFWEWLVGRSSRFYGFHL